MGTLLATSAAPAAVGPWKILRALGQGGMGVVYEARHTEDGRRAALKTVWVPSERQLSCLRREIHVLSRLDHPGIVHILDRGVWDGLPWYAMELIEGAPLTSYIRPSDPAVVLEHDTASAPSAEPRPGLPWWTHSLILASDGRSSPRPTGIPPTRSFEELGLRGPATTASELAPPGVEPPPPLPPSGGERVELDHAQLATVLVTCQRLCRALAFLHGEGIVHRDLKPENVIVRPSGLPVIVDFGLMTEFARAGREPLDAGRRSACTLAYAAPEQLLQEVVDARADLYALGCIVFELCAGTPPFWSANPGELARHHLFTRPPRLSERVADVPRALDDLLQRLLAKRPRDRIGYAIDVATSLASIAAEVGLPRRPLSLDLGPTPRTYLYRPGFAGRAEPLQEIERSLEEVRRGSGAIVVVDGDHGIGKTRLAMEAVFAAERLRYRVLVGECVPQVSGQTATAGAGPLHPLRRPLQAIADLCHELGAAASDAIFGRRARLLSIYEPVLADLPGQAGRSRPTVDPRTLHAQVCTAVTEVLESLGRQDPLLLVIDDVQWADELSLAWLRSVAGSDRLARMPLLVLATTTRGPDAADVLDLPGARHLTLGRLEENEVGAIVCDMLALREPPRALARFLASVSHGNPFFVAEYLRAAVADRLLVRDAIGRWRLPEGEGAEVAAVERLALPRSLRALVERRLASVGKTARRVAEVAAVFGREADVDAIGRVTELPPDVLAAATTELLGAQILTEPEPGSVAFVHDRLREVAYEAIPITARPALHRAAARALVLDRGGAAVEALAAAARQHELGGEPAEAVRFRCQASTVAEQSGALPEALAQCDAGVALAAEVDDDTRLKALLHRGRLLSSSGRAEAAAKDLEQALLIAETLRDLEREARACVGLSYAGYLLGDADRTLRFAERAALVARALGDPALRAESENALGIAWGSRGLYRRAIDHYGRAAEIAESTGDEASLGRHLGNLAINHRLLGELDTARTLGVRALEIARRQGQVARECNGLVNLGLVELDRGDLAAAREAFQTGLDIATSLELRFALPEAHAGLAEIARREGALELAEEHCGKGLEVAEEERHAPMVGTLLRTLASVASERARRECGSQNAATDLYQRSVEVLRATGASDELAASLTALGRHLGAIGRTGESAAVLEEAARGWEALGLPERARQTRGQ